MREDGSGDACCGEQWLEAGGQGEVAVPVILNY